MRSLALALFSLVPLVVLFPQYAMARACVANFSESGRKFESHIETRGDPNKAIVTLARAITSEGFLGLTVNKDVGVVSAYQEDNGKKSAVSATVSEIAPGKLRVETSFLLATGLRASPASMREHLCTLLESTLPEDERARMASDTSASILLKAAGAENKLEVVVGQQRKAGFGPVLMFFMDFSGPTATVRTTDPRPVLTVPAKDDPAKSFFIVRLDPFGDGAMRTLKIGSAKTLFRAAFTGHMDMTPDANWTMPSTTRAEPDGRWSIAPLQDLPPGEYGLWDAADAALSDFAIDGAR